LGNPTIEIQGQKIGLDYPTYFVADIAANHDGDLERAKHLIKLAKEAGADAVKFQNFQASKIVSDYGFKRLGGQQSHQKSWGKTVFEVYQDASIPFDWTETLANYSRDLNIHYFSSPYDYDAVDHLEPFVSAYKIGSGDITWWNISEKMARKGKPVILASGASQFSEVEQAVDRLLSVTANIALLQCNTNYTASLENVKYINLNVIKTYAKRWPNIVLGLSDHTSGHTTVLGAIALGARIIEKHFTDDCNRIGPDHKFSMTPKTWREMVDRSRELENALGDGIKRVEGNEAETVVLQRRAVRAKKTIHVGATITRDDVEVLRPCPENGIPPYLMDEIVGRKVSKSIKEGEHISWESLSE
jgi:sialic acid synthase SpsE